MTETERVFAGPAVLKAEVSDQGEDADQPRHAALSRLLSAKDARTLARLQEAGLIELDAELGGTPERLTGWTYDEFRTHMLAEQQLAQSTAKERVRYVRFLEDHDVPVHLRPPQEDAWTAHVAHRRQHGATGDCLNNYRKALISLLRFLDVPIWDSLKSKFKRSTANWRLPPNDLVPEFWTRPYRVTPLKRTLMQYVFFFGFHTGVRAPSELAALDVDDVDLATGEVRVPQPKKGLEVNVRRLPDHVVRAHNAKSLKNWLDIWRPRLDPSTSALFPNTLGNRWSRNGLRKQLAELGRRVWAPFTPYTMRRWYATSLLIATDYNVYVVAQELGNTVAVVENHYLDKAKARNAQGPGHQLPRIRTRGEDA